MNTSYVVIHVLDFFKRMYLIFLTAMFLNVLKLLFQGKYLCCTPIKKKCKIIVILNKFMCESYYSASPVLFTIAVTIQT